MKQAVQHTRAKGGSSWRLLPTKVPIRTTTTFNFAHLRQINMRFDDNFAGRRAASVSTQSFPGVAPLASHLINVPKLFHVGKHLLQYEQIRLFVLRVVHL